MWHLLLAFAAALGYSVAALGVKRALMEGAGAARVNLVCNLLMAGFYQLLWLWPGGEWSWSEIWRPMAGGVTFFLGQIFTFLALSRGDVSVTTPLLGIKVIFVAVFLALAGGIWLPWPWWIAAGLCAMGVFLVGWQPGNFKAAASLPWAGMGFALAAAASFALTDVLFQLWVPYVPAQAFIPLMFGTMGLLTIAQSLVTFRKGLPPAPASARPWLWTFSFLLTIQALFVAIAIGFSRDAAGVNIVYGARAILSVLLVKWMGRWFRIHEMPSGEGGLARRLIGGTLIFSAILVVVQSVLNAPR